MLVPKSALPAQHAPSMTSTERTTRRLEVRSIPPSPAGIDSWLSSIDSIHRSSFRSLPVRTVLRALRDEPPLVEDPSIPAPPQAISIPHDAATLGARDGDGAVLAIPGPEPEVLAQPALRRRGRAYMAGFSTLVSAAGATQDDLRVRNRQSGEHLAVAAAELDRDDLGAVPVQCTARRRPTRSRRADPRCVGGR